MDTFEHLFNRNQLSTMPSQPTATLETITPAIAKNLLEVNKKNRPVRTSHVNFIAEQMEDSAFVVNGETIKISKTGKLLDGQHRLMSIVKTGKTQKIFVVRGLDDEAFKTIDTGRGRTGGDILAIDGISTPDRVAALVKFILSFQDGRFSDASQHTSKGAKKITNVEVSAFVKANVESIGESLDFGYSKENRLIPKTILSALHFIFKKNSHEQANQFCTSVATGENLSKTNPVYVLREKFMIDARATRKMNSRERVALIIKAWNLIRKKETVKNLKWDSREDFPKPL